MSKILNVFFLFIFLSGTFLMSPGARALDINNICIGECGSSITDNNSSEVHDSSFPDTVHYNCGHCCHYGHAINTFFANPAVLGINQQTFAENFNSPPFYIPYGIKRPPRIAA